MFYRVSTAVISPALVRDLGFTNAQLSDLAAVFFYAFALSQIPIGIALDRLGSRITMFFLSIAAVGGAVLFAFGQTPGHLILARALLGIGMSGNLMVIYALLAVWFPLDRFAFLGGLLVSIGVAGNLLAATPLALLSMSVGWRTSFVIFAAVDAAVVAAFLLVVRDRPDSSVSVRVKNRFSHSRPRAFTQNVQLLGHQSEPICPLWVFCGASKPLGRSLSYLRPWIQRDQREQCDLFAGIRLYDQSAIKRLAERHRASIAQKSGPCHYARALAAHRQRPLVDSNCSDLARHGDFFRSRRDGRAGTDNVCAH